MVRATQNQAISITSAELLSIIVDCLLLLIHSYFDLQPDPVQACNPG